VFYKKDCEKISKSGRSIIEEKKCCEETFSYPVMSKSAWSKPQGEPHRQGTPIPRDLRLQTGGDRWASSTLSRRLTGTPKVRTSSFKGGQSIR
jgi:hypothetical protein